MKPIPHHARTHRHRGLYVVCPLLALLLAALHLFVSPGPALDALYGGIILAALPTWDRRFLGHLAVGCSFLILLAGRFDQAHDTAGWLVLANTCIGLLVVWGAVRLCWHAIAAHEQQVRSATHSTTASSCNCDWRGRMLTMCAWSKQLKDGGSWVPVEEFFNRHFKIRISHGVCEQIRDGLIGQAGEMRLADEVQTAPVQRC
jgi:hypothetical protein